VTRKEARAARAAEVVREYGPFPGVDHVAGVTFDGNDVWFGTGDRVQSLEPKSGKTGRSLAVRASAGTAFDGEHIFQIAGEVIQKIDPHTGTIIATIPVPPNAHASGLTWAEGTLWVGGYKERRIHQIDPDTGRVLRTIESTRFVTGVTFVAGELWHATLEDGESELRHVDAASGEVLERVAMPEGITVSGLESDGADLFYCGGGTAGKVRAVRKPKKSA
jgi:DNA-binding beta-propeller fold protein YncE